MKKLLLALLVGVSALTSTKAQSIETPANTALTIASDMNMPNGKSLQIDGANFIKLAAPSTGNVFMGIRSGASATPGGQNTFVGFEAGKDNTASANAFFGYQAGFKNQGGSNNVFIGQSAGYSNVTGANNMFLGTQAGYNTTSAGNLMMGNASGINNITGGGNTFIGDGSGLRNVGGTGNIAIGQYAGSQNNGTAINGDYNLFMGWNTGLPAGISTITKAVAIGANALVSQSNAIALGGTGANAVNVGIGTPTPANTLQIGGAFVANTAGIRLPITISSTAQATNQTKFLTVNAAGDVILGSLNASTREGVAESSYWQTSGDNIVNTNEGGVVIGSGIAKTPVGYKLYVAGGMLTEKVKVALRNKSEWSDYVFEKGYKLTPLSEVSAFIKANGHLPGVPSADEMVNEGLDVAKMNAKLLEKVEELTLYMLNQQKQIQKLQNDNKKIKQQLKSRQ